MQPPWKPVRQFDVIILPGWRPNNLQLRLQRRIRGTKGNPFANNINRPELKSLIAEIEALEYIEQVVAICKRSVTVAFTFPVALADPPLEDIVESLCAHQGWRFRDAQVNHDTTTRRLRTVLT